MPEEVQDERSWEERHITEKVITKSYPKYGWMKVIKATEKDSGKPVMSLFKFRNRFNIKSQKQLNDLLDAMFTIIAEMKWELKENPTELTEFENYKEKYEQLKIKTKEQKEKYNEKLGKVMNKLDQMIEEQYQYNIPNFEKDLKEFSTTLDGKKEKDIQNWLADRPWIFGPTYVDQKIEERTATGGRLDFILKRYDTFYDVVELKLPTDELFKTPEEKDDLETPPIPLFSRETTITKGLSESISQLIGYLETIENTKGNYLVTGKLIHKPKGILIIGKSSKKNKKKQESLLKTLNSYFHNIEIKTYDQLLDEGENFVKLIKKRKTQEKK